jgi:hypothetical protein
MPYGSRHLATGLGGIGQEDLSRGRRPRKVCGICGRITPVSSKIKSSGSVSYCHDCRVQERALIEMWEVADDPHGQPAR